MIEVFRAAAELQALCERKQWRFCVIGGLALQRWGEPRETIDVDITLLTGFGNEEPYIEQLLQNYDARIPDATAFAMTNRVLLLRAKSGVGIDIALGALPFEEECVQRATLFEFPGGVHIRTCSAEDLIVMKAFANREKDWIDIEGVLIRQADALDWPYIQSRLAPLAELKGVPEIVDTLRQRRAALGS